MSGVGIAEVSTWLTQKKPEIEGHNCKKGSDKPP